MSSDKTFIECRIHYKKTTVHKHNLLKKLLKGLTLGRYLVTSVNTVFIQLEGTNN